MSEVFLIEAVGDPREWESAKHGGRFFAYPLTLEGVSDEVEWSRKVDSDPPKVGDRIAGSVSGGPHGKKLKVDWDAMRELNNSRSASGGGSEVVTTTSANFKAKGSWQPEEERDPGRSARILRQHSQECAIRLLTLQKAQGVTPEMVFKLADAFDADVNKVASQAKGSAGGAPAPAPPAGPPSTDVLFTLLEVAGLNGEAAKVVGDYVNLEFNPEQRQRAIQRLQNPNEKTEALESLKTLAEKFHGEHLPTAETADNIPF